MEVPDFSLASLKTPSLSLEGLEMFARVVDVYDGDTMTVVIKFHDELRKIRVRLLGIDTAEMNAADTESKLLAIRARDHVIKYCCIAACIQADSVVVDTQSDHPSTNDRASIRKLFLQHHVIVYLRCSKFDKYGRTLANVHRVRKDYDTTKGLFLQTPENESISDVLLREGLAKSYFSL